MIIFEDLYLIYFNINPFAKCVKLLCNTQQRTQHAIVPFLCDADMSAPILVP